MRVYDRDQMILDHYDLVRKVAQKMRRRLPAQVELDELISLGTPGLIRAVDLYDPNAGSFEAFCRQKIRGAILDGLRALDWAPRSLRRRAREINTARADWEAEQGTTPTEADIADVLGISASEVSDVLGQVTRTHALSLDEAPDFDAEEPGASRYEHLAESNTDDLHAANALASMQHSLLSYIASLEAIEQLLLVLYYFEGMTLGAAADVLRIPESRASQMHTRVVMELRRQMMETYAAA